MQSNNEIQLKDILTILVEYKSFLLRKKPIIIGFTFLFALLALIYTLVIDEKYNAEITFVIESESSGVALGDMEGIASQFGFDIGGGESNTFSQNNVIELLKSRGVIVSTLMRNASVSGEFDLLVEHYIKINKLKNDEDQEIRALSFHGDINYIHDSITGVIWENIIEDKLDISLQSNEANIIKLSYISSNQYFAKEFVTELIAEMSKMYVTHQTVQANNTLDFLQDRADSVFGVLEIAEQEFARVKDINQRIIKASGRLKEMQLMRRVEVLNAMYLEIIKNLEISKLTLLNRTPIINIIDEPILPLKENKMSQFIASLLGGFLGFLLSFCFLIFRKLFADTLERS